MAMTRNTPVLAVLPSLPEETPPSLVKTLSSVGVKSEGDPHFTQEAALQGHISPIQCRGLLDAWRAEDVSSDLTHLLGPRRTRRTKGVRQQLEPDEAQRLKREAWRAASRRYYARKMARLRAHRPPQGQLHPLGATASPCFLPASMTTNNNNNSHSSINNNNNNNRKRRKRILDLPEETQSSQREAWRAASKRYYARRSTGLHPDPLDLAHFLQDTQGMSAPQS